MEVTRSRVDRDEPRLHEQAMSTDLAKALRSALSALDDAAYHAEKSDRHDAEPLEAQCREAADDVRAMMTAAETTK